MEEFVINEAKIKEDLDYLDDVNGLTKDDKKMVRCDLIAGIDRSILRKYYKRNVSQTRKKIISFLLRAGSPESVADKYLDKKIKEEKIGQAVRYINDGVPAQYVDLHFKDSLFPRLCEYWLYEQNLLKKKKEKENVEKQEVSDGLIRTDESETNVEDKSDEMVESAGKENVEEIQTPEESENKVVETENNTQNSSVVPDDPKSDETEKVDSDVKAEAKVVAEALESKVEAEEKKAPKEENSVKHEAAASQNTVINGFTFEQMMELFSYMNNNANCNAQKMHTPVSAEEEKAVVEEKEDKSSVPAEPVESNEVKQPQPEVLTEEKLQAIVSAAMKQTIEEAKKQTLEEINRQHEIDVAKGEKAEKDPVDIYIDDIRREISELRREADENKKTENALRNELEEKNKETADRMMDYYEKFKELQAKAEEKESAEPSEEDSSKNNSNSLSLGGYIVPLKDTNGNVIGTMPVEIERRRSNGIGGLFGLLGFKKKSQQSLVRMVISGELNKEQLSHIVGAMKKGLSEGQLTDLIESKVPAEKMPEIIEIALLEKSMGYAY